MRTRTASRRRTCCPAEVSLVDAMLILCARSLPQDGKLFVYIRASDSTSPTDYSQASADLGLGALASSLANIWS